MKILVTGGAGFIGSHLVDALTDLDNSVTILDNFSTRKGGNIDRHLSSSGVRLIRGDVSNAEDVRTAISYSCVFLAGLTDV